MHYNLSVLIITHAAFLSWARRVTAVGSTVLKPTHHTHTSFTALLHLNDQLNSCLSKVRNVAQLACKFLHRLNETLVQRSY